MFLFRNSEVEMRSLLAVLIMVVGCKSEEPTAPAKPSAKVQAVASSAAPTPKGEETEEVEIDAHCEMISRDPAMLGRVRVDRGQVLVEKPEFFEGKTAKIPVSSYGLLNEVAYQICKTPEIRLLEIGVHTDTLGTSAYNERISQERADALLEYISDFIEPSRLQAKGYGESKPVAEGISAENHARNRRVEFVIQ